MTHRLLVLVLLIAAAGCAKVDEPRAVASAPSSATSAPNTSRQLAYQHSIQIDTGEPKVSAIFEAAQTTCREASADLCTVLEARINTGRSASASLKFRARPAGIQKLIAALSTQAEVTDQSTSAEDLAGPIEDAATKLAMLNDYRAKLEALRDRASRDIDALIKVNKELAQVQSDLEAIAGKHAHLVQRVETEILSVSIRSIHNRTFWKPIGLALSGFSANLSQGISIAIVGIAYLIPWIIALALAAWGGRRLWRRWRRPKSDT